MRKEIDLWQFILDRLSRGHKVMLLVVAQSSGSSPGRPGYKMAVGTDGELKGSIGGGVMEVNLVESSRQKFSDTKSAAAGFPVEQVHKTGSPQSSGMICSGRQTIIFKMLTEQDAAAVKQAYTSLAGHRVEVLTISPNGLTVRPFSTGAPDFSFEKDTLNHFVYQERLGPKNDLYIIGGGHCALALSEFMSKLDFYIRVYDDRPDLNTLASNSFADEREIIDSYESIGGLIDSNPRGYVVAMTLGYRSDEAVIKQLVNKDFRYFGVLGSEAKMATVMRNLIEAGIDKERLSKIHTPIGLPIKSHSPEEIAVSIAAEIISIKNADDQGRKKNLQRQKKYIDKP